MEFRSLGEAGTGRRVCLERKIIKELNGFWADLLNHGFKFREIKLVEQLLPAANTKKLLEAYVYKSVSTGLFSTSIVAQRIVKFHMIMLDFTF